MAWSSEKLKICRFCGKQINRQQMRPLLENWLVAQFYEEMLPANIRLNDIDLPDVLCIKCFRKALKAAAFLDMINKVDGELRKMGLSDPLQITITRTSSLDSPGAISDTHIKNKVVGKRKPNSDSDTDDYTTNEQMSSDSDNDEMHIPSSPGHTSDSDGTQAKTAREKAANDHPVTLDASNLKYKCGKCLEKFPNAQLLKKHIHENHQNADLTCSVCMKQFSTSRNRARHMVLHDKATKKCHNCSKCGFKFTSASLLARHSTTCDQSPKDTSGIVFNFKCPTCDELFGTSKELMQHRKSHVKQSRIKFTCEICKASFANTPLYHQHIRIHPELAIHPCDLCDKKFHTLRMLSVHKYQHTGVKSHVCEICGKAYLKKPSLAGHQRAAHTGEKPFACKICNQTFSTMHRLREHQYKHIFDE